MLIKSYYLIGGPAVAPLREKSVGISCEELDMVKCNGLVFKDSSPTFNLFKGLYHTPFIRLNSLVI